MEGFCIQISINGNIGMFIVSIYTMGYTLHYIHTENQVMYHGCIHG